MSATGAAAEGVRARVRRAMRAEIMAVAWRHLAEHGPGGLSLRAVARDVGLASSAVYRYFPSRDALLTDLIVEAYDELGQAVETAEATVPRAAFGDRYRAVARAIRGWALAQPQHWALLFGSPVPGYHAPQVTVGPATRVPVVLSRILTDAAAAGLDRAAATVLPTVQMHDEVDETLPMRAVLPDPQAVSEDLLLRGLVSWTYIVGAVSMQLFGHRHQVVAEDAATEVYEAELDRVVELFGWPEA